MDAPVVASRPESCASWTSWHAPCEACTSRQLWRRMNGMDSRDIEKSDGERALRTLLVWRAWGAARLRNEYWQLRAAMCSAGELMGYGVQQGQSGRLTGHR